MYRHTQVGYVTLGAGLAAAAFAAAIATLTHRPPVLVVAAVVAVATGLFASLTITVGDGQLRSHFGPGFWRKRVPLQDIAGAELAPSAWWEGWGIRITPRGMLYNVSGTGAVEVRLRSGSRFRLGTDEPEALLRAIRVATWGEPT